MSLEISKLRKEFDEELVVKQILSFLDSKEISLKNIENKMNIYDLKKETDQEIFMLFCKDVLRYRKYFDESLFNKDYKKLYEFRDYIMKYKLLSPKELVKLFQNHDDTILFKFDITNNV